MSSGQATVKHRRRQSRGAAGRTWLTGLVSDGRRSLAALGVDGWLAVAALTAGAIALAPLMAMTRIPRLDAGTVWQGLYLLACIRLIQVKGIAWPWWLLRHHPALCGFLLFALLSTAWSDAPGVSLNRSLSLIGTTLVGVCIGQLLTQRVLMAAWMWGLTTVIGVSIGLYLLAPDLADRLLVEDWAGRFRGFTTGKNHAGKILALAAILFTAATIKGMIDRSLGTALTAIYAVGAIQTESATSVLSLTAGVGMIGALLVANKLRWSVRTVLVLMAVGTCVVVVLAVLYVEVLTGLLGKKATLSGRTLLWTATLDTIAHQPLLGFGYYAIWSGPETNQLLNAFSEDDFSWSRVPHAHNGFFQIAADLGVPVAVLAVIYVIGCLVRAIRAFHRDTSGFALFAVGFITAFIVMNIGSLTLLRSRSGIWIVFVAVTVALARSEGHHRRIPGGSPTVRSGGPAAIPLAAAQLRQRLRAALTARQEDGVAGLTALRQQLEDALRQRHGDRAAHLEELRGQLRAAVLRRDRPSPLRLARLRRQLRRALQRRPAEWRDDAWSAWTGLRPHLRRALMRRTGHPTEAGPSVHEDVRSSSI